MSVSEHDIERIILDLLREQGYALAYGNSVEREAADVVLHDRLQTAIAQLNPQLPQEAHEEAFKRVLRMDSPELLIQNEITHRYFTEGVDVSFRNAEGDIRNEKVRLFDFEYPANNDWLAANQVTIIEHQHHRRPDIVLYANGLPIVVIEIKNATDEQSDTRAAFNQIQTYQRELPSLFAYNLFSVVTDYWFAKAGTISSDWSRYMEWKSADGTEVVDTKRHEEELPVMVKGMLAPARILDLLRHFTVFEKTKERTVKKLAAYHQYFAVNRAIETTVVASRQSGDQRAGVVWHTQGSGKSLSMVFYTGKLVLSPQMNNPTIVVLTDRNDLDQQLFETFSNCNQLIRQTPAQAENRSHLRKLLQVASGGVVFTTIQKFLPEVMGDTYPELTDRHNVVVVADEAHRSQYDFIDGFAKHMRDALPNASFIGFTGTPIEKEDANTRAVFGDYVHVYDIHQAVEDGATVRIYYESRLAKIELDERSQKVLDEKVEELTESDELTEKQKHFAKWASKEAVVGSENRLRQVAQDLVKHFELRSEAMEGKGMVVAMSRRICVALHDEIIKIRPEWHSPKDSEGKIKVIMTGSASDPLEWQEHIRNKSRRKQIGDRLKAPGDPLKLVIVRDMWLTGFDAPPLHTLYVDKPMSGHNLMQAIARVNRVFKDKKGGLVVDYIGIAQDLKKALAVYTESGGKGKPNYDLDEAAAKMMELYEVVVAMYQDFDYKAYFELEPKAKLEFISDATEYVLSLKDGKARYKQNITRLLQAFGISVPHPDAMAIRDDLAFFEAVKSRISKLDESQRTRSNQEIETAIRQVVSESLVSYEVMDIFQAAGLEKPEISVLSDEFLAEVQGMQRKNLALELLRRLLNDELKTRAQTNITQSRKFSEILAEAVKRYQNGLITAAQVIEELIKLTKDIKEADKRGEALGLQNDELAFYDALHISESAEEVLGDETLRAIARELVDSLRKSISIDWNIKESVQAAIRVRIKRILRKYKYPPEETPRAIEAVMEQTDLLARYWAH
ncbi:MAG: type I restriction endonuclease subunit R [Flavobacteriales bacterium]